MMKFFHLPWTLGIWVCRFADWVRFLPFAKSGTAAVAAKHFKLRDYKAHNWLQEHTHTLLILLKVCWSPPPTGVVDCVVCSEWGSWLGSTYYYY
jgi:hypothetical protein